MDPVHQRLSREQSFLKSDRGKKGCHASEKYPDAEIPREELLQGPGLAQCYPVMAALIRSSQSVILLTKSQSWTIIMYYAVKIIS